MLIKSERGQSRRTRASKPTHIIFTVIAAHIRIPRIFHRLCHSTKPPSVSSENIQIMSLDSLILTLDHTSTYHEISSVERMRREASVDGAGTGTIQRHFSFTMTVLHKIPHARNPGIIKRTVLRMFDCAVRTVQPQIWKAYIESRKFHSGGQSFTQQHKDIRTIQSLSLPSSQPLIDRDPICSHHPSSSSRPTSTHLNPPPTLYSKCVQQPSSSPSSSSSHPPSLCHSSPVSLHSPSPIASPLFHHEAYTL